MTGVAAAVLATLLGTAAPASAVYGNMCDYGIVIAVRGTDAPAGTDVFHDGRIYANGGWGAEILPFINMIKSDPFPYYYHGLVYPASGGAGYASSVAQGRTNLVNEMNYVAGACGAVSPAVILIGHSQGAAVVRSALVDFGAGYVNLTAQARFAMRAAVLFGDPNYKPNQPINSPDAQNQYGGVLGTMPDSYWQQINQNYLSYGSPRIRSYCLAGDAFCASGTGANALSIHNSYGALEAIPAYHWMDIITSDNT